ncbi:MAG: hypothetical protein IK137_00975, partial [Bacilli bacterium]|nr:hypothetical protein [Bacilli bacterium]
MDDLKKIKNAYGEKMMHFCRDNFPTILEKPGSLYRILSKLFHPSKLLIDDINKNNDDFKDIFINIIMYEFLEYRKYKIDEDQVVTKTPAELLDEAGYILYECKTEEDIQKFRKYYKRKDNIVPEYTPGTTPIPYNGEELCTFNGGRLKRCRVFFAVKKNVDEIKREDFTEPKRQDEYGTSVISIQFANDENNTISIKNRYNHTITDKNPDATFGNNLDNIIPGLTKAFEQEYDLNITSEDTDLYDELSGYIRAEDGKYYKYNYEADNIYYCPDNIIIENRKVKQYDKSRYLLVGQLLIDFQDKTISICPNALDNRNTLSILNYDSFLDAFSNIKSIKVET